MQKQGDEKLQQSQEALKLEYEDEKRKQKLVKVQVHLQVLELEEIHELPYALP